MRNRLMHFRTLRIPCICVCIQIYASTRGLGDLKFRGEREHPRGRLTCARARIRERERECKLMVRVAVVSVCGQNSRCDQPRESPVSRSTSYNLGTTSKACSDTGKSGTLLRAPAVVSVRFIFIARRVSCARARDCGRINSHRNTRHFA